MNAKKMRSLLNAYHEGARKMELAEACISLLEILRGEAAQRCIQEMKSVQQEALTQMDAAAERMGAPYPKAGTCPINTP